MERLEAMIKLYRRNEQWCYEHDAPRNARWWARKARRAERQLLKIERRK